MFTDVYVFTSPLLRNSATWGLRETFPSGNLKMKLTATALFFSENIVLKLLLRLEIIGTDAFE